MDDHPYTCHDSDWLLETHEREHGEPIGRRFKLYCQHPEPCPDFVAPMDYLIHPPSRVSPTSHWHDFRDNTVLRLVAGRPDDPNCRILLRQVEMILAWRAVVPEADRFWKPDPIDVVPA